MSPNNSAISVTATPANSNGNSAAISSIEEVLIGGDLSKLSAVDRLNYYQRVCESLGLNPLTKPFDYIKLSGRMTLYANKDCANQLRSLHKVSISKCDTEIKDSIFIVTVTATTKDGRSDCDIGCISIKNLSGEALGNAMMKCVTKAKRRVTLSICGLGWLDQSEIESIPEAKLIEAPQLQISDARAITAAIVAHAESQPAHPKPHLIPQQTLTLRNEVESLLRDCKFNAQQIQTALLNNFAKDNLDLLTDKELTAFSKYLAGYAISTQQLTRLKWTPQTGKQFLKENFNDKSTRAELTLEQMQEFLEYLASIDTPSDLDFNANPTLPTK